MSVLGLQKVGEYSSFPEYYCPQCKQDLWTERSGRTGWREWCVTKTGVRHFKTKCNLKRED